MEELEEKELLLLDTLLEELLLDTLLEELEEPDELLLEETEVLVLFSNLA